MAKKDYALVKSSTYGALNNENPKRVMRGGTIKKIRNHMAVIVTGCCIFLLTQLSKKDYGCDKQRLEWHWKAIKFPIDPTSEKTIFCNAWEKSPDFSGLEWLLAQRKFPTLGQAAQFVLNAGFDIRLYQQDKDFSLSIRRELFEIAKKKLIDLMNEKTLLSVVSEQLRSRIELLPPK